MDPRQPWVVPLSAAADCPEELVGGKTAKLARARSAGLVVPSGFCVTTRAYKDFLAESRLSKSVAMELGRKPLENMRWEEIWDTALRIRSEFLRAEIPDGIASAICRAVAEITRGPVAVRSSALGEDSAGFSFAGLHESVVGVSGDKAVLEAVRRVWASLWSDAALLYRRELSLDPMQSRMAVLVQEVIVEDRSGVAFGRDPRNLQPDCAIVEAVPGQCALLVDGAVDPDRWIIRRPTGEVVQWRGGIRDQPATGPLLEPEDLDNVFGLLTQVETLFGWPPDVEWTGRSSQLTLLQARPISTTEPDEKDNRSWYLSLRPGTKRLRDLARRVSEDLIPKLEAEGVQFASEDLTSRSDEALADAVEIRLVALHKWKKIYRDDFIPFAHGVRELGRYYNDAVHPDDPYEFVGLVKGQDMLASRRNRFFAQLAGKLRENPMLKDRLARLAGREAPTAQTDWLQALQPLREIAGGDEFLGELQRLAREFMDITVGSQRLADQADSILPNLLELAGSGPSSNREGEHAEARDPQELETRLLEAVGQGRRDEAIEVLRVGRLSWRLRDDDNLLVSRIESQLYRAAGLGAERLRAAGRLLQGGDLSEEAVPVIVDALRNRSQRTIELPLIEASEPTAFVRSSVKPRQLVGQPAAPGIASGLVRRVKGPDSFAGLRSGQVLVCDAIQPMMTHLVPLAAAVVERRGGMLIQGAIIARELGIPCVNGIVDAMNLLDDGDLVTVDGHLGIVTVGPPEFDIELEVTSNGKN